VDLAAASAHGVVVTSTPGANTVAVAELTWALILAAARRVPELDRAVNDGGWPRGRGVELAGKTLGLVGFGAIGRAVAARAGGFAMRVIAHDPYLDDDAVRNAGAEPVDLATLVAASNVISLHAPLTDATHHLLDRSVLAAVKRGAILVNTSRGGLVDESAVLEALADGRLRGVGLDVYEHEPPTDSQLVGAEGVVCTPHVGAHTAEAVERMAALAVANLLEVLRTGTSAYRVDAPGRQPRPNEMGRTA
jgi:phosphoglycerate dehydrogenase-like enzyme